MGTPDFAVPALQALYQEGHDIAGVITQPDRPAGRGRKVTASPVKVLAENLKLPVFQPLKVKEPDAIDLLRKLEPECIIVVAYGQILSKEILELPRYGCVNVHASLLPAYRGAAPIHWAVLNGELKTGVTTMLMNEGLDTGDMLLTAEYPISPEVTTGQVHDALADIGADILLKTIKGLKMGTVSPKPQPSDFTYAPLLKREHEKIDWNWSAHKIHNRIRGLNPWPGAFAFFRNEQIKIWHSRRSAESLSGESFPEKKPGEIVSLSEEGFMVQTGDGILEITELQPAGKKKMNAFDFFNGRRIKSGEFFE